MNFLLIAGQKIIKTWELLNRFLKSFQFQLAEMSYTNALTDKICVFAEHFMKMR